MGARFSRSALEPLELGAFGYVPKKMAHFGWAKTDMIIQVHGVGPFSVDYIDPVYELTKDGVSLMSLGTQPRGAAKTASCFTLKIGDRVRGTYGEGTVVGGHCSPANRLTQYWVQKASGERFWGTSEELNRF